ncbi:MAG: ABC transporter ATP-binding protein [Ruminococcaceae bacterium]|nr:ABC transporter ATP-binding protein [Oscillospiraceae bacterium]
MKKVSEYTALFKNIGSEWKWLLKVMSRYRLEIAGYTVMGVVGIAMGLGASVASKFLIDAVVGKNSQTIIPAAALVIGLAVFQLVVNALSSFVSSRVGTRVNNEIRAEIYEAMANADWENINKYHSGDLINRLEGDVNSVSGNVISFLPGLFTKLMQFFGCLAIVLYYDATLALLALMSAPVLFFSSRFMTKMMRKYNLETREMNGKILSFSEESVQNLQTIKAFGLTKDYSEKFRALLTNYRNMRLSHDKFTILTTLCLSFIGLVVAYSCYGWGVYRLWSGAITFGTMTLFLQLSGSLTSSFSGLVSMVPGVISVATAAGRIKEITELKKENTKDEKIAEEMLIKAREKGVSVIAENLTYSYADSEKAVLNKISFSALPGETIAFVGPSGEGKTTILRLILGLVNKTEGELKLKIEDSDAISVSPATRRFCSYVPQENAVFTGTIAENMRIVKPDATDEEIKSALKIADALDFVEALPLGIETAVGERGVNFSEGQVQRLSIARAVLCNAPLLVMDEATSALDSDTEERVLDNLMQSNGNQTRIITTHRPSMLNYCHRIYELQEDGTVKLRERE